MPSTSEIVLFCVALAGLSFVYIVPHVFPKKATAAAIDDKKTFEEKATSVAIDDENTFEEKATSVAIDDENTFEANTLWSRYEGRLSIDGVDQGDATFVFNADEPMHHIEYGEYDEDNDYILDIQKFDYYYDNPTKPTAIRFKIPLITQKKLYLQQNKGLLFYHDGNNLYTFTFDKTYKADWSLLAANLEYSSYVISFGGGRSRRRHRGRNSRRRLTPFSTTLRSRFAH